jgi:predicted N-acetyltransferase YhbS
MTIESLLFGEPLWESLAEYAYDCSWGVGEILAKRMRANGFSDWERVFVALDGSDFAGYCTFVKTDCIPNVPYTPYISAMFVGEAYRGNRLSEKLICFALEYAKKLGFDKVYLVSNHVDLYEKYGFVKIDVKPAPWDPNDIETIFVHAT